MVQAEERVGYISYLRAPSRSVIEEMKGLFTELGRVKKNCGGW